MLFRDEPAPSTFVQAHRDSSLDSRGVHQFGELCRFAHDRATSQRKSQPRLGPKHHGGSLRGRVSVPATYVRGPGSDRESIPELHQIAEPPAACPPSLPEFANELARIETVQSRVERTSHLLVEMTRGSDRRRNSECRADLDQVDLLALPTAGCSWWSPHGTTSCKPRGDLDEQVSADEFQSIRNYLNQNFSGWLLTDIRRELELRLRHESAAYDRFPPPALLYEKGLLDFGLIPRFISKARRISSASTCI